MRKLTAKQLKAAIALASGISQTEVAKSLSISRETLRQWQKVEEFKQEVAEIKRQVWDEAIGAVISRVVGSIDTIDEIRRDEQAKDSDRLAAAKLLIDVASKWANNDLGERIERLEAALENRTGEIS